MPADGSAGASVYRACPATSPGFRGPRSGQSLTMGSLREENISYWVGTGPETDFPRYVADGRAVDVAVVGAGITGLSVGLFLQRTGLSVAVLETGRGGSGGTRYTTP